MDLLRAAKLSASHLSPAVLRAPRRRRGLRRASCYFEAARPQQFLDSATEFRIDRNRALRAVQRHAAPFRQIEPQLERLRARIATNNLTQRGENVCAMRVLTHANEHRVREASRQIIERNQLVNDKV